MLKTVLILGGTSEAASLANALSTNKALHVITSLAGRTTRPRALAGEVRTGGFGGIEGLLRYLREQDVEAVIDATHPFAAQMSRHAADACSELAIPRLSLTRPCWPRHADDRWYQVTDAKAATTILPGLGRRVFLTSGQQDLDVFKDHDELWFLIRTVEPIKGVTPKHWQWLQARGPFTENDEMALLQAHGIDVLVTKASGGTATYPKIAAARRLSLPVVMIKRPNPPDGPVAESIEVALTWLQRQVTD